MSQVLEELKQIIIKSDLCVEDQNDLLVLLPIFPEESIRKLVQCFQKDQKLVKDFNRSLKARLRVLINGKDEEWEEIQKEIEENRDREEIESEETEEETEEIIEEDN